MENNEIMERLLQDDKQQKSNKVDEVPVAKSSRDSEIPMSRIRVVTAKYKVYIVLLLIFICILLLVKIPEVNDSLKNTEGAYSQVNSQLDTIERNIRIAEDNVKYLCDNENWIVKNEKNIVNCLNNKNWCKKLPESWQTWDALSVPVSYIQLHSLYNKKMPVDEKRVLKNLNEYLIKQDIVSWGKDRVWDILSISIWDPQQVNPWDDHFFKVTVDVEIEFQNIWDLTGFLHNVEKKLIENGEDRILYKIQTVSYDIVTNNEPQITHISMMAYYYHDERFGDETECESTGSAKEEPVDNDNWEESDSFFQKIFNDFKK